jgi:hypothetical protein
MLSREQNGGFWLGERPKRGEGNFLDFSIEGKTNRKEELE